jgi:hypothetical protein
VALDHVTLCSKNFDSIEVWKMGEERDKTLFFRKEGDKSIGRKRNQ